MASRIVYKDLLESDSIRLLLLQPPSKCAPDEIHCKLFYTSLDELIEDLTLHYTALSYVWGDESHQREIFVDGVSHNVTLNLFSALRSLRHGLREFPLWVDAVCINQLNIPERNQQVSFMGAIYAFARHTVIYLGDSDADTESIFRSIVDIQTLQVEDSVDGTASKALFTSSILSRPWFGRIWVLQELALSSSPIVQCGTLRVKWSALEWYLSNVSSSRGVILDPYVSPPKTSDSKATALQRTLLDMATIRAEIRSADRILRNEDALLQIVQVRRGLGAKDPRDVIYAHLGMFNYLRKHVDLEPYPPFLQKIVADYTKSVVDVYNDFARIMIEGQQHVSISTHVLESYPQTPLSGLASWTPDWTLGRRQLISKFPRQTNDGVRKLFQSGLLGQQGTTKFQIITLGSSPVLTIVGFAYSLIEDTSVCLDRSSTPVLSIEATREEFLLHQDDSRTAEDLYQDLYHCMQRILGERFCPPLPEDPFFEKSTNYKEMTSEGRRVRETKNNGQAIDLETGEQSAEGGSSEEKSSAQESSAEELSDSEISYDVSSASNSTFDATKQATVNTRWALRLFHRGEAKYHTFADYIVRGSYSGEGTEGSLLHGRKIALLENGSLAFVPEAAMKGDLCCIVGIVPGTIIFRQDNSLRDKSGGTSLTDDLIPLTQYEGRDKHGGEPVKRAKALSCDHGTLVGECRVDGLNFQELQDNTLDEIGEMVQVFAIH